MGYNVARIFQAKVNISTFFSLDFWTFNEQTIKGNQFQSVVFFFYWLTPEIQCYQSVELAHQLDPRVPDEGL